MEVSKSSKKSASTTQVNPFAAMSEVKKESTPGKKKSVFANLNNENQAIQSQSSGGLASSSGNERVGE